MTASGHVLVLTAGAGLADALADAVAARLGQRWHRIGPDAAEMPCAPMDRAALDVLRAGAPVDLNAVPAEGRRKSVLLADMDSTIITVECIDELADLAGVKPQVAAITERAMAGELDFEQALTARVALLEGLPVAALDDCYRDRVRLTPGAAAMIAGQRAAGSVTALVSGGFTFFSERVAAATGFDRHMANVLLSADGHLTGRVALPILGRAAKLDALHAICAERGTTPRDAVAIGDGANDLAMIGAAGLGIAWKAKPALRAAARAVLDHSDLTAVLRLQGLPLPT